MKCPICSFENAAGAASCGKCGTALTNPYGSPLAPEVLPPVRPAASSGDEALATVIPYKNAAALLAYYLGLFSCFPVLGFPLAVVALVAGVKGLKAVRVNPRVHGTAHAWIGLVCGTIGFLINALIILALVAALLAPKR